MKKLALSCLLTVALLVSSSALAGPPVNLEELPSRPTKLDLPVVRVIDGDTFETILKVQDYEIMEGKAIDGPYGIEIKVRLMGVDCPETRNINKPDEYKGIEKLTLKQWGLEAKSWLKGQIEGEWVTVRFDSMSDTTDDFGRLLVYVIDDGADLNAELVRLGLARVTTEYNFEREAEYVKLEQQTVEAGIGMWENIPGNEAKQDATQSDIALDIAHLPGATAL
jgi:micrococcal nuclease